MNPIPTLSATERCAPPTWAVLERRLIDTIDAAAPIFLEKYTRPGGALIWQEEYPGDGVWADDLYEAFFNWPLYHTLGGSDYTGTKAVEEWNAVTRQIEFDYGRAYREFVTDDDWFHNAENYIYFYHLGMADPTNREMMRRARRFAGFYTGEDPTTPNYDPQHRVVRSPFSGSKGPLFDARFADVSYNLDHGHTTLGPGFALTAGWQDDEQQRRAVHDRFNEVVMHSDVPVNLSIVPLVATAFMYTGDTSYRDWIAAYVGAWLQRTIDNDGILPDNVGPGGVIGERRQGQWWGGFYGWTGRFGHQMVSCSLTIAAEAALLVTGDHGHLELLRTYLDLLIDKAERKGEKLRVPHKHTDDGWTDFGPMLQLAPIHLWTASMADVDLVRLERLRAGYEDEWAQVRQHGPRSQDDRAWTRYLEGDLPDYPERILQANYREVCDRTAKVLADEQDLTTLDVHWWQQVNPVVPEALVQLATGGPEPIYWGGLAQGRVRYFDAERRRAGLPPDVAALVTSLKADSVGLTLVNLSATKARSAIVGAGSFAEHAFGSVRGGGQELEVDGTHLQVDLPPGTGIELEAGMSRYCQRPTFAHPWHERSVIPFR